MSNANPDRWNAIFQAAPYCIKLIDPDGRILDMNPAGLRILGASSREQVVGASVFRLVLPEYQQTFQRAVASVCAGGREEWDFEVMTLTGDRRWMESSAVPLQDGGDGGVVALAMSMDVTERNRADQKLRQLHDQLSYVARVSTMGEMASEIAHELNQPLTAVIAYADACLDLLQGGLNDVPRLEEILRAASGQAERAGKIIHRLRTLVRRSETTSSGTDVNEAVREVAMLLEGEVRSRQIQLQLDLEESLPGARADFVQVQQVLLNLTRNSIDAVGTVAVDRRRIGISTSTRHSFVEVAVSDNGCGISPAAAAHIFEPFFSTRPKGLGMGLVISRSIVEFHGGRLDFSYNPDGGVTFRFSLPQEAEGPTCAATDRVHRG